MAALTPYRFVARITVEFTTPFAIRSGNGDALADSRFVTDPNGLPAIPGASLAGVLRHAAQALAPDVEALFGHVAVGERPGTAADQGEGSRLTVSWGVIHDARNVPVDGMLDPDDPRLADPVLQSARQGLLRDHVRIGHHGSAVDAAKFDERLVPAGHRFTADLTLRGTEELCPLWDRLLALLAWPGLRLGAGSRRGFGCFRLHSVKAGTFDLRVTDQFAAYALLPVSLAQSAAGLTEIKDDLAAPPDQRIGTIILEELHAERGWLFGGGAAHGEADMAPIRERVVEWSDAGEACLSKEERLTLPASALKGVLAHRLAWNYNRVCGVYADHIDPSAAVDHVGSANAAVRSVFGTVSGDDANDQTGVAGRLLFGDAYVEAELVEGSERWHVSLDRFSQGARAGRLFREWVMPASALAQRYAITLLIPDSDPPPDTEARIKTALRMTLKDLRDGRLAFGAGVNRGHGGFACRGLVLCDRARAWLDWSNDDDA